MAYRRNLSNAEVSSQSIFVAITLEEFNQKSANAYCALKIVWTAHNWGAYTLHKAPTTLEYVVLRFKFFNLQICLKQLIKRLKVCLFAYKTTV